ncbi:Breast cancer anti-estrogen resistance protein 1-like Protein [Tribolium castaneum]|uniref:Breast cancer anti-estrogen resistance protein 1 n=1 Tax=Tribolium castaneum TaxID=7070 RepID=D6WE77_TRICA|nr:PREDICTED: breast cancer anti-estrogen resistance protein 1 [Tribolium castaneum]EEZ99463.2 Breast cancer anti-estrogen resistance protein 1-like Protein [Tribolium castaneum]|eukprot:XP_969665.1 PREDICTED: breast cancer anti-estrogen resistance protein 1 [Tribolium castaneum]
MPQPTDNLPPSQHCLARALYDNIPDSPDELAFRKGDTLIVLEQNTANIEGWWLCSLRGRQGICPANRLRLIPGVYEDTGQTRVCSPQLTEISGDFSCLQRQGKRRSWHVQPNQVVTPKKYNDVYLYDMPPPRCSPIPVSGLSPGFSPLVPDCYDVPPRAVPVAPEFRNCTRCSPAPSCVSPITRDEAYDIPRSLLSQPSPISPSSSASSLTADSLSSSNRSSLANMPDYDVPRPLTRGPQFTHPPINYDILTSQNLKELPLELNSALENLERLQSDTTGSISKLLGFVGPQWRTREKLESNLMEIKLAVIRLRTSLHDLAEFGEGTLGNATRATDKNLASKLTPLVVALKKSDSLVCEATEKLNDQRWTLDLLARSDDDEKNRKPDELEQLVACSRALTEDIRQIASFIQGNGLLLFKREPQPNNNNEWLEDYDYVSLDSKEAVAKQHAEIREALPEKFKKTYDSLVKHADDVAFDSDHKTGLDSDDKQLLSFFAAQLVTHHRNLTQAIDAFLQTVEHNQPPKVFLAHGKFVVLSAHKLVHIGDTVHRNVSCKEIKERALNCANALSDALATSVNKTKQAALQFPNVTAVQEMVDSIVDISYSARDLKVCLVQAANPM